MYNFQQEYTNTEAISDKISKSMRATFLYMSLALLITFAVAGYVSFNETLAYTVSKYYFILVILELVIAFSFSFMVNRASKMTLLLLLFAFSVFTGLTFSSLALVFSMASIIRVLIGTIVLYAVLAIYGYTTSSNLYSYGPYLMAGLIAIIIMSVINMFIGSSSFVIFISFLGVIVFTIYTAYEVNVIKNTIVSLYYNGQDDIVDKLEVYGAFSLYLNFINLFIYLLQIFGGASRD